MRLGLVVQRYGDQVDGGAEVHCRAVAQRLALKHDVSVLTTCAKDYLSWANHFPQGESKLENVKVLRFPVKRPRRIRWFNFLAKRLYEKPHTIDAEWRWLVRQGPYAPGLLDYLLQHEKEYDAFIFWTYLYFPTAAGLPLVSHKSLLVPTAHDETPLYLSIFRPLFNLPRCILFNAEAERQLVHRVFSNQRVPSEVVGLGIDPPLPGDGKGFKEKHGIKGRVLIYMGRVDVFKGCGQMFEDFTSLVKRPEFEDLHLVLVGKSHMEIPNHPQITSLGFVSEQEKADALDSASLLLMPSAHESLSMVTLEAGLAGKPVIVNRECEVLAQYVKNSGAGLSYKGTEELAEALSGLLNDRNLAETMGAKGKAFVEERFEWEKVLQVYERVLAQMVKDNSQKQA